MDKELLEKAKAFCLKLDKMHKDENYLSIWQLAANSRGGQEYQGPNYYEELKDLKTVIKKYE